ncbi:MAG: NTP transferase domain-containing protein [Rhodospirillaceae bacterium]|nr:NTP transferase domain-containing protein [Rhodospirillaceae bacterium]MYH38424.1 NTP transferase domain-containing protein [Rhodospirillaceae bacterium]MYK14324.1 NTP transferase domain-containing protein [Rhodospirillaceae bacterium]
MEFGSVPIQEAEGAILAHAVRTAAGRLAKGRRLTKDDLAAIADAGFDRIAVARLDPDDLDENDAAARIAAALASDSLRAGPAANGRCNLYARHAGLALIDAAGVSAANRIAESLTLATLPALSPVVRDQLVATVKIITFGAPAGNVERVADAAAGTVSIAAYRPQTAALIQTRLPHTTAGLLAKTERSTRERLARIGAAVTHVRTTEHREDALADALAQAAAAADLIAVIGASAIADRRDVVPAAIVAAGGTVEHFGLPVDPGNLTLLARLGKATVVAMPGSARSPREQGSDWLLERLAAGLPVDAETIAGFGVGGLLKEIRSRPMLRDREPPGAQKPEPVVDAILLAAGQSTRMGARNKLLEPVGGEPMIRRVAAAVRSAAIRRLIVVTGHEAGRVRDALSGLDCAFADNPDYPSGMGSSVAAGARAVFETPDPPDAAIVCLGDMPDIAPAMLDALIDNYDPQAGRTIVAAASGGQRGHPVLWDRRFADDLASLGGDTGGRDILQEHAGQVVTVEMDDDAVLRDLDTPVAFDAYRDRTGGDPAG